MRFGFLISARCNAACRHCTTSCGPHETAALSQAELTGLMDQAAALWRSRRSPGEMLEFSISGGEPFLDFPLLLAIVAHGHAHGATIGCVTNGYWAASDAAAREKLLALKRAGLRSLAVSTSRFHEEFIRVQRVERALRVAGELGLRTALKCAVTADDGLLGDWARRCEVTQHEIFPVVPYLRNGETLPERTYLREDALPEGRCPYPTITIREDGQAYTCCMPGGFVPFLALGNTHEQPLADVYRRFYLGSRQQVLRERGPAVFARAVAASGEGARLRGRYESVCDLCAHIAGDPVMARVADEVAADFAQSQRLLALQENQDSNTQRLQHT